MPEISRDQAVRRLAHEVASAPADDLAEVYNELFPSQPATEDQARGDRSRLLERITDHIGRGLQAEEIVALWNVVFPKDRNVYYDEEADRIHYNEESEFVQHAD